MINSNNRTVNVIKNTIYSTFMQIFTLIISFASRTFFIKYLGNEYLSINGLITNILSILSFTELGLGSAIIYSMYKPIYEKNDKKVSELLNLYKKAYRVIIISILILGILIMPFLSIIIKNDINIKENLNYIYILYLINTISTYILSYKKSILIADQKNYIVVIWQQLIFAIQSLLQLIILITTKNFTLYIFIQIICNIINNYVVSIKVDRLYPYLKLYKTTNINKEERKKIFNNVKSLLWYKIGSIILNSSDNIIISAIINLNDVGICSNYYLIINIVNTILTQAFNGLSASIGNHNIGSSRKDKKIIFDQIFIIAFWIFGISSVLLMSLINPFIEIWIGRKYLLPQVNVIVIVMSFYTLWINIPASMYRTTLGYFKEGKLVPIFASIINVILSVVLGIKFGLIGIFLATIIARILTFSIMDPLIIFKNEFKLNPIYYYIKNIVLVSILIISYYICRIIISFIKYKSIFDIIIIGSICFCITNFIFIVFLWKTKEFKNIILRIKQLIYNRKKFK